MRKDYTHVCVVLDASGSMEVICNDVKGSFNTFLETQRSAPGKTVFDLFQFATRTERIVKSVDLSSFEEDLMAKYHCCGGTAMNDAICTAIDTLGREFAAMPEEERPAHVLFAIITDGEENSSEMFTLEDVKERITHQKDVYQWEFVFMAANLDAFQAGAELGISASDCVAYSMDSESFQNVTIKLSSRLDACRDFDLFGTSDGNDIDDDIDVLDIDDLDIDAEEEKAPASKTKKKKA